MSLLDPKRLKEILRLNQDGFEPTRSDVSRLLAHIDAQAELLERAREQKDGAYAERNQCVALIARMALARGWLAGAGRHPDSDATWEDDWRTILFVNIPDVGQVSWHFHDSEKHLLAGLPEYPTGWDGHDTQEKYRRVNAALTPPPQPPQEARDAIMAQWRALGTLESGALVSGEPTASVSAGEEGFQHSLCVQCGPDVGVDEDGCCATCGAMALGEYADSLLAERDALRAERDALRARAEEAPPKSLGEPSTVQGVPNSPPNSEAPRIMGGGHDARIDRADMTKRIAEGEAKLARPSALYCPIHQHYKPCVHTSAAPVSTEEDDVRRPATVAEKLNVLRADNEVLQARLYAALQAESELRSTVNRLEVELQTTRDTHAGEMTAVRARAEKAETRATAAEDLLRKCVEALTCVTNTDDHADAEVRAVVRTAKSAARAYLEGK